MKVCKHCGCNRFIEKISMSGISQIVHTFEEDSTEMEHDTYFPLDEIEQDLSIKRRSKYYWCEDCGKRGDVIPILAKEGRL